MAIYHFSAQVISRSSGGNAIAAAAYRAGEKIEKYDYSRKKGIAYSEILAPENAPEWAKNREKLWRTVEDSEKRKDSQLCREINVALPLELKTEERKALLKDFCTQFIRLGMVADIAMHQQDSGNPHAHIMLTMRELTPDGFGGKRRDWNRKELVEKWRAEWAKAVNLALEKAGHDARIDHRSLAAQGVEREPTLHQGKAVSALERKGIKTRIGLFNAHLTVIAKEEAEIEASKGELFEVNQIVEKRIVEIESSIKKQISMIDRLPKEHWNSLINDTMEYIKSSDDIEDAFCEAQKSIEAVRERQRERELEMDFDFEL